MSEEQVLSDEEKQKIEEEERIRAEAQKKYGGQNNEEPSFIATLLLCLFLGPLGIHRFYVGKTGSGIAMLLLSLTFVGLIITGPWSLVDFIVIAVKKFQDKDGNYITAS